MALHGGSLGESPNLSPDYGADFLSRNLGGKRVNSRNREVLLPNAKFSVVSAENSKACCISSLSVESLKITIKAPESRLAADNGLELSHSL
jgi:hypothetical protein